MSELRELEPPLIARRLRFVPFSETPRVVCLNAELYGCDADGTTTARSLVHATAAADFYVFVFVVQYM